MDRLGEAARLVRRARLQAGLSQAALARSAGVAQSVISAYENGHREPSLATLRRLVEATGQTLRVDLAPPARRVLPDTPRGRLLDRLRPQLRSLVHRYDGTNLRVFGSVARGDDDEDSDIDLVVDLPAEVSLLRLLALRRELAEIVGQPLDLVPARSLRPVVASEADRDGVTL